MERFRTAQLRRSVGEVGDFDAHGVRPSDQNEALGLGITGQEPVRSGECCGDREGPEALHISLGKRRLATITLP
jgi:hypothetical protein